MGESNAEIGGGRLTPSGYVDGTPNDKSPFHSNFCRPTIDEAKWA